MNILSWILFGLVVGIVANALDAEPKRGGLITAMLLGITGALVGGFLADLAFGVTVTGFNLTSFLIAITGSLLLLFIGRSISRKA